MKNLAILGFACLFGVSGVAQAQEPPFPRKGNIEMTVLFPAGSSADVTARLLADGMARQLGATIIVVDRPGAGGALGYRYVAGQRADGYALVWNSNSISTTHHSGTLNLTYEAFDAVAQVLVESPVLAVRADSKWKTLGDIIAAAKAKPNSMTVANSGVGSHTHISSVALFRTAGAEVVDVPFAAGSGDHEPARRPGRCRPAVAGGPGGAREERANAAARFTDRPARSGFSRRADRARARP